MKTKLLIIDDHPAMIEGYKTILSYSNLNFDYDIAHDCETAYHKINFENTGYDMIFLDISLPAFPQKQISSGIDLAVVIQKKFPRAKLIVITSQIESLALYSIVKDVSPEGLFVKSDFSPEEMITFIDQIVSGETVYTKTVKSGIKAINAKDFYLDSINRQIITLLTSGVKTKRIPDLMNLSLSAIDKRKVVIKDFLGILKGNDEDIIRESRKRGLI